MANLQRYLANRGARVHLVSITVDPERDTVERLAAYAAGFAADPALWKFATGPAEAVKDAVVRGFKVGIEREKSADDFTILHGTRFVLVDGKGAIRGYYDAADGREMANLRTDLERLAGSGGS
jgi:protein SCO1/2